MTNTCVWMKKKILDGTNQTTFQHHHWKHSVSKCYSTKPTDIGLSRLGWTSSGRFPFESERQLQPSPTARFASVCRQLLNQDCAPYSCACLRKIDWVSESHQSFVTVKKKRLIVGYTINVTALGPHGVSRSSRLWCRASSIERRARRHNSRGELRAITVIHVVDFWLMLGPFLFHSG